MKHSIPVSLLALLCAVMTLLASCAMADGFDLSSLSDTELVSLLDAVNGEVVSRGIQKTAVLSKGTYIVGKDIPAGRYLYTCLATGDDWGNVTVYSSGESRKQVLWEVVAAPEEGETPETFVMTLNEGDELKSGVPFSLTVGSGVVFR